MKEERILKKVDKLLKLYGVEDGEREKFLLDLKDKKYDDQDEVEETVEEEESTEFEEEPAEEVKDEGMEEVAEEGEKPAEEFEEEKVEEESAEIPEEPVEEAPVEEPAPMEGEQPAELPEEHEEEHNEVDETIKGLMSRIEALEELVKQLGTPVEEESDVGVAPRNPSGESMQESEYERYNRLRKGRP